MRLTFAALLLIAPLALGGCIARTAVGIVTLPVRAVGGAVDMVTTSQSERDEAEGRRLRREDERRGREAREQARRERRDGHARDDDEYAPQP